MNGTSWTRRLLGVTIAATLGTGLASCSTGHEGHQMGTDSAASKSAVPALHRLDAEQFASRMAQPEAAVINVHIPYEGELEGTDAFIPFDHIVGDTRLPADKASAVLLYCRSGRMSETASAALLKAGYSDVSHLEGGMQAWEAAGKPLVNKPQEPSGAGH
jgi:rhodanese-related sulfurtransferase